MSLGEDGRRVKAFRNVAVGENLAYLAMKEEGVAVFDITEPGEPRHVTTIHRNTPAPRNWGLLSFNFTDIAVAGRHIFLADESQKPSGAKLYVVDMQDPQNPRFVNRTSFQLRTHHIHLEQIWGKNLIFTAERIPVDDFPLKILDVTDPYNIVVLARISKNTIGLVSVHDVYVQRKNTPFGLKYWLYVSAFGS
ncbi:MAG: hypothetical protein ACE5JS_13615, partial [Nitrospinota bacterium]